MIFDKLSPEDKEYTMLIIRENITRTKLTQLIQTVKDVHKNLSVNKVKSSSYKDLEDD
ncbi:MAG TPA: hypothetical protein PLC04_09190 [Candidatus Kapabacteria bacterium]|nr:hypothetical protein [Candidatus Kapabacteria bacterium]